MGSPTAGTVAGLFANRPAALVVLSDGTAQASYDIT
jgi:hypothetical protein